MERAGGAEFNIEEDGLSIHITASKSLYAAYHKLINCAAFVELLAKVGFSHEKKNNEEECNAERIDRAEVTSINTNKRKNVQKIAHPLHQRIMNALDTHEKGYNLKDITALLGENKDEMKFAITLLLSDGKLTKTFNGTYRKQGVVLRRGRKPKIAHLSLA